MRALAAAHVAASVVLVIALGLGQRAFGPVTLGLVLVVLVPTLALLRWLGLPALPRGSTRRGALVAAVAAAVVVLVGLYVLFGRVGTLVSVALAAAAGAWLTRASLVPGDARAALALGAVAAVAGLGAGWVGIDTLLWAALQLPLTALGLLAGWGLIRRSEIRAGPAASALFVSAGPRRAAGAAFLGAAAAVPWALFNVAAGGAAGDTWVRAPWQVLAAVQPAIAEEAWARVFLIAVLYAVLRRTASARAALVGAILVAGYWFAWLHVHELTAGALVNTVVAGTLFSLPLTLLWLRRGLEAAIGFHFAIDATRFAFAYLGYAALR